VLSLAFRSTGLRIVSHFGYATTHLLSYGTLLRYRRRGWSIAEPLRHLTKLNAADRRERTVELLEQMGLGAEHAERLPQQMSGGQLQRANIARALAILPQLVVLDEALSNLDRVLQLQLLQRLDTLRRQNGTAFVLISHDLSLIQYFCQRVVLLDGDPPRRGSPHRARPVFCSPCRQAVASGNFASTPHQAEPACRKR
jgi:ABC-type glutathione transport system ATPase component